MDTSHDPTSPVEARQGERLPPSLASTATALYLELNETPVPRPPSYDGLPPLVDWRLDVDRAPCAGEMTILRSTLDFASDSRLATEFGVETLSGEVWLVYPGDVLRIIEARPGPTRVEGHGRPGGSYAAVWEDVTLRAGTVDIRELTFRTHKETYDLNQIWAEFRHPSLFATPADLRAAISLPSANMYLKIGGQTQHPEAVQESWQIGPDRPSRCATPGTGATLAP